MKKILLAFLLISAFSMENALAGNTTSPKSSSSSKTMENTSAANTTSSKSSSSSKTAPKDDSEDSDDSDGIDLKAVGDSSDSDNEAVGGNYLSKIIVRLNARKLVCGKGKRTDKIRPRSGSGVACKKDIVAAFMLAGCKGWVGVDTDDKGDKFNGSGCDVNAVKALSSSKAKKDNVSPDRPDEAFALYAKRYGGRILDKICQNAKFAQYFKKVCGKADSLMNASIPAPIAGTTGKMTKG